MKYTEFWKSTLEANDRRCYEAILSACKEGKNEVSFGRVTSNAIDRVIRLLTFDHPELFYLQNTYQILLMGLQAKVVMSFAFPWKEAKEINHRLATEIKRVMTPAKSLKTDFERVVYVHDYFSSKIRYRKDSPECFTIVGPLLNGYGACEGISKTAELLLNAVGIDSLLIPGEVARENSAEPHAWNIVFLDGKAYHNDFTSGLDGLHPYCNVNDELIRREHSFSAIPGIRCNSMEENYHIKKGLYFKTVAEAKSALPQLLRWKGQAEVRLGSAPNSDHSKSLADAVLSNSHIPLAGLRLISDLPTQTYMIRKG